MSESEEHRARFDALRGDDVAARLRAVIELSEAAPTPTVVRELEETATQDNLGELSVIASVALVRLSDGGAEGIMDDMAGRYREKLGRVSVPNNANPSLRSTYTLAVGGRTGWFDRLDVDELATPGGNPEFRRAVEGYVAASRRGKVKDCARLMVWFEALDLGGTKEMFAAARSRMPRRYGRWLRHLERHTSADPG